MGTVKEVEGHGVVATPVKLRDRRFGLLGADKTASGGRESEADNRTQ